MENTSGRMLQALGELETQIGARGLPKYSVCSSQVKGTRFKRLADECTPLHCSATHPRREGGGEHCSAEPMLIDLVAFRDRYCWHFGSEQDETQVATSAAPEVIVEPATNVAPAAAKLPGPGRQAATSVALRSSCHCLVHCWQAESADVAPDGCLGFRFVRNGCYPGPAPAGLVHSHFDLDRRCWNWIDDRSIARFRPRRTD